MAAPRSSSLRALRVLSQQPAATPYGRRGLHITGVHSAQPINVSDKASLYTNRTLADLKSECQKRSLRSHGTQTELAERLFNHDVLQSRAFSIALRRINGNSSAEPSTRQFNTSRSLKAVGDSSTVDFAYFPSMEEIDAAPSRPDLRFPILSDMYNSNNQAAAQETSRSDPPMKPQVYAVGGGDFAASPMSEVVDNHSVDIDPFSLTETVSRSRFEETLQRQQNGSQAKEPGVVKELWTGFMEDLMGPKQTSLRK